MPPGYGFLEQYPHDSSDNPVDTPDWRDPSNIKDTACATDGAFITAVRKYSEDPSLLDAAIDAGADLNAQDKYGYTPLMLAYKSKNEALADLLLEVDGVDLNIQTKRGFTALMVACWKGLTPSVSKLIDRGAKIELYDTGGRNCWGVAHDWHKEEVLEVLKKHGMEFKTHGGTQVAFPPAPKWRMDEDWT